MAIRNIRTIGDPILEKISKEVKEDIKILMVNKEVRGDIKILTDSLKYSQTLKIIIKTLMLSKEVKIMHNMVTVFNYHLYLRMLKTL